MNKSEQINELAAALAKAQAKIEAAPKDNIAKVRGKNRAGDVVEYSYNYSTLADVWAACRSPLSENGLAVVQTVTTKGQAATVTTMLAHSSGQWISEEMTMLAGDEKPQSLGSAISYARRYALGAIVGVVSEEDDDGNTANGNDHQTQRKPFKPAPVKPAPAASTAQTNGNGNGKPAPQKESAAPSHEEQLLIRLSESLPEAFESQEAKDKWQTMNRPFVNGLPAHLKKAFVEDFAKVAVRQ